MSTYITTATTNLYLLLKISFCSKSYNLSLENPAVSQNSSFSMSIIIQLESLSAIVKDKTVTTNLPTESDIYHET